MINEKITASIDLINSVLKHVLIHDKIIEFNHLDDANNFIKTGFIQVPLNTNIIADGLNPKYFNFFINNFGSNFIKKYDIININVEFKQNENVKNISYNNYIVTQVTIDNNEQIATIYFEDLFYLFKNTPIDFSINEVNQVSIKEISGMMVDLYTKKWKDFYGDKFIPIDFEYNFDLIISNMVVSNGSNMMQLIDLFDKEYLIKSYFDENKLVFGYNFINYYENDINSDVVFSNASEELIYLYNRYLRSKFNINIILEDNIIKKLYNENKKVVINVITTDGNLYTYTNNIESNNIMNMNVYSDKPEQFKKLLTNDTYNINNDDNITITTFIYPKVKRYDILRIVAPFAEKNYNNFILSDSSATFITNSVLTTYTNSDGLLQEIALGNKRIMSCDIEFDDTLKKELNKRNFENSLRLEKEVVKSKVSETLKSKNDNAYNINEFLDKINNKNLWIKFGTIISVERASIYIKQKSKIVNVDEIRRGRFYFYNKNYKKVTIRAVATDQIIITIDNTEKIVTPDNLLKELKKLL